MKNDLEKRFWNKIDIISSSECWEWKGAVDTNEYGAFKYNGKKINSHRMAWFLTHGSFPKFLVLHSCDNRLCCNPAHLFLGTHKDNVADMIFKKRDNRKKGENHPSYIDAKHGTLLSYKHRCRCKECRRANAESKRSYRARMRESF